MSIFFLPAFVGLIFKLFILTHVIRGAKVSTLFLSLIIVFAIHNAIEAFGYIQYFHSNFELTSHLFRMYYVATIYMLMYIILHAITISGHSKSHFTLLLIFLATTLSAFTLFSNLIINGERHIGYTITAIKGPYYWLFSLFFVTSLLTTFLVLINGQRTAESQLKASHCKYSLIALMPILFVGIVVIILKTLDINLTAAGILPIATTIFLIIVLKTESKHKLSDISKLLPLSLERQTANSFLTLLDEYVKNGHKENVYKDLQRGIEKEIVTYSLKKCNNNISETAKMMGIRNRSTLYAMIKRLNIDYENTNSNINAESIIKTTD